MRDEDETVVCAVIFSHDDDDARASFHFWFPLSESKTDFDRVADMANDLRKRIRAMVKVIRKSSLIDAYMREKMVPVDDQKELVCDPRISWSSTWLMLEWFLIHTDVIQNIISSLNRISGLERKTEIETEELRDVIWWLGDGCLYPSNSSFVSHRDENSLCSQVSHAWGGFLRDSKAWDVSIGKWKLFINPADDQRKPSFPFQAPQVLCIEQRAIFL